MCPQSDVNLFDQGALRVACLGDMHGVRGLGGFWLLRKALPPGSCRPMRESRRVFDVVVEFFINVAGRMANLGTLQNHPQEN